MYLNQSSDMYTTTKQQESRRLTSTRSDPPMDHSAHLAGSAGSADHEIFGVAHNPQVRLGSSPVKSDYSPRSGLEVVRAAAVVVHSLAVSLSAVRLPTAAAVGAAGEAGPMADAVVAVEVEARRTVDEQVAKPGCIASVERGYTTRCALFEIAADLQKIDTIRGVVAEAVGNHYLIGPLHTTAAVTCTAVGQVQLSWDNGE